MNTIFRKIMLLLTIPKRESHFQNLAIFASRSPILNKNVGIIQIYSKET